MEAVEQPEDTMILLQLSIVNKLIKKVFPDKVITNDFRREFTKALSLFILYLQNNIDKKKYSREDILAALEREGFGRVAMDLRSDRPVLELTPVKRVLQEEEPQPMQI
jgi:hypothetical protein